MSEDSSPASDMRRQTLDLIVSASGATEPAASEQTLAVIKAWLAALDDDDFAGCNAEMLASSLWPSFSQLAWRPAHACQIAAVPYADGRGGNATALLIVNADMPFLVDSVIMALARQRHVSRAVLNAVLALQRSPGGMVERVGINANTVENTDHQLPRESFVLCLLTAELHPQELAVLSTQLQQVAADAAVVHRDALALAQQLYQVANAVAARDAEGKELAEFLRWAGAGGFELFGYAYYRVVSGQRELARDLQSRIGILQDTDHPLYGTSLAGIPGDLETLAARADDLSVVKADVSSSLHRDQLLDFIGVRERDEHGAILGEHCFVGLFSAAAEATALVDLPFVRGRIASVLQLAQVRPDGFRAEKFREILQSLPRTEVWEAEPAWLAQVCGAVVSLYKTPRSKVFARRDVYRRHLNVLLYLPRERYSASVADALAQALQTSSGASEVRSHALVANGPLARLYLIAKAARYPLDLASDIAAPLLQVLDGWHDAFEQLVDAMPNQGPARQLRHDLQRLAASLPPDYVAATSAPVAFRDLLCLLRIQGQQRIKVRVESGSDGQATLRLCCADSVPSLARLLPPLDHAGVAIHRERTNAIVVSEGTRSFVTCLSLDAGSAARLAQPPIAALAEELFEQLFNDEAEDGRLNGLVLEAALHVREVQLLRAYLGYWRQAGSRFSVRYVADCLRKKPQPVRMLIDAFLLRFNPRLSAIQNAAGSVALQDFKVHLIDIEHADTEEILRNVADLMLATVRTSYFQPDDKHCAANSQAIVFKFDSSALAWLPEPRPYREIFVFARRFEGVHLRGGPVARGGLRWSDRMEDYRTEVLGLMKAQMVKNAVIVPVGAKGGFVCKMLPKGASREVIAAEGEAVYRLFIAALLAISDNRVDGAIDVPAEMVLYDQPDPYLVVAADKGTATFSDIANSIALQRGFWLGDAFASGGSQGYDHKKLGITARGAWEAIKRHCYEIDLAIGIQTGNQAITVAGIGDMSGDVFGNGMIVGSQLQLLAAFDHRHIFIDPRPDPSAALVERVRLFGLPRSSWDDYDQQLISSGGGVWPRSARTIALSPQARQALGIEAESMTPDQLIRRILQAPVDLLYNGGVGTYIKASSETHEQVKDRANDALRVDAKTLRCRIVAEGGNLGVTQAGRIEFALQGGRIFSDAIDNSAGVDCSDHEVNAKIWLDTEVRAGMLDEAGRNRILVDMTPEIVALVLRDNALQTHLLAREVQAQSDPEFRAAYAALITNLEAEGIVSREQEQLPTPAQFRERASLGQGLVAPELAVVIAHAKNRFKRVLAAQDLLAQPWARSLLTPYFPAALAAGRDVLAHPLAQPILATVLANEAVNRCGPCLIAALAQSHQCSETDVLNAWAHACWVLQLAPILQVLDAHALSMPRTLALEVDTRCRALQGSLIDAVLAAPAALADSAQSAALASLFSRAETLSQLFPASQEPAFLSSFLSVSLPVPCLQAIKALDAIETLAGFVFTSLAVARPVNMDLLQLLALGMQLHRQAGIDVLEQGLKLPARDSAQAALRDFARQTLGRAQQDLLHRFMQTMIGQDLSSQDQSLALTRMLNESGLPQAKSNSAVDNLEQALLQVWLFTEAVNDAAQGLAKILPGMVS
ncbi:MAG: NAD-glutamate dehydrogenase domain-containing protein [Pseudomonadota bacterium]